MIFIQLENFRLFKGSPFVASVILINEVYGGKNECM